jgi:hypothetical protein
VARSVLLVLLAVAVGLGALDVFAAGQVLPDMARHLWIRRMGGTVRARGRPEAVEGTAEEACSACGVTP